MDINNIRSSGQDSKTDVAAIGITYGYIRVSTVTQHDDRQRIAMEEFGITADHIFADKQRGKDFARPQYRKLLRKLRREDIFVVKSIDRLGRNYAEILEQWRIITKEKRLCASSFSSADSVLLPPAQWQWTWNTRFA